MKRPRPVPGFASPPATRPNFSKISRWSPAAIPGPRSVHRRRARRRSTARRAHLDRLAGRRVLDGVVDQVRRAPAAGARGRRARRGSAPATSATIGTSSWPTAARRDGVAHERAEVDVAEAVAERARVDARRVEHVADRAPRAASSRRRSARGSLALVGLQLAPARLQRARGADHRRHRAAQLVRDERDEVGAQRGEAAQLLDRAALALVGADVLDRRGGEPAEQRRRARSRARRTRPARARPSEISPIGARAGEQRRGDAASAARARRSCSSSAYSRLRHVARGRSVCAARDHVREQVAARAASSVPGGITSSRLLARGRDHARGAVLGEHDRHAVERARARAARG